MFLVPFAHPHVHLDSASAKGISMARLSAPLPAIIHRLAVRILQIACRAQQHAASDHVLRSQSS